MSKKEMVMIRRFEGSTNRHVLVEALLRQFVVNNDGALADELLERVKLREIKAGEAIIQQGASDNAMYFILVGLLSVQVSGREIARRAPGQQVGEMALIDVYEKRSASVIAVEDSVVAEISEADFSELASRFPVLWRRLALDLGKRIRERGASVRPRNETPRIFIGCSKEGLDIARAVQTGLSHDLFVIQIWTDDVFKASKTTIENLMANVETSDFGLLVLSPDDTVVSRGDALIAPRDNVIFELGLYMGGIGRERTFILKQQRTELRIPSDLFGTTPLEYQPGKPEDLAARVGSVCTEVRKLVQEMGSR